ncbi:RECEPTOR-LIKE SERINE/THREONINE-PROTEIN KINASE SD1-8 [Salix koriyanagi]|uniref:RECEPTOR-LIKE SERINE/THREONINE-PROTEIN KINASE SD1-8 n=1 Tax=Salix koriyanagi TaxID=2511006 RepID=A0A9Q0X207_9ROSI|nr:RECEPTOR-LIKE SERINE/THREONINE-PROTEIN KINASE SD1-8 [Salix koriyanagi]
MVSTGLSTGVLALVIAVVLYVWRRKQQKNGNISGGLGSSNYKHKKEPLELPLFDFDTMAFATGNFSDENKLGEGGFGIVYKVQI